MRNLKKVLSLALAMVMLLGMMVVGASAADATEYPDYGEVSANKQEAVQVITALSVMDGTEKGMEPQATLNRAMAATIIARTLLGRTVADALSSNTCIFTDVPDWAKGAVQYCADMGIVYGIGNNLFGSLNPVKGTEFAAMLLRAVDPDGDYSGESWASKVIVAANKNGLSKNIPVTATELNREGAAQMAFNTITDYSPSGATGYTNDDIAGVVFDTWFEAFYAGGQDATKVHTAKNDTLAKTVFGLSEGTDTDAFGRDFKAWKLDGEDDPIVVTNTYVTAPAATFTAKTDANGVKKAAGITNDSVASANVTENGDALTGDNISVSGLTGNGKVVEVYVSNKAVTKVIVIDTEILRVSRVASNGNSFVIGGKTINEDSEFADLIGEVQKDDYLAVVRKNDNTIIDLYIPDTITGTVSFVKSGNNEATIDGESVKTYNDNGRFADKAGAEVTVYLVNGYAAEVVDVESGTTNDAGANFIYVTNVWVENAGRYDVDKVPYAMGVLADGTVETLKLANPNSATTVTVSGDNGYTGAPSDAAVQTSVSGGVYDTAANKILVVDTTDLGSKMDDGTATANKFGVGLYAYYTGKGTNADKALLCTPKTNTTVSGNGLTTSTASVGGKYIASNVKMVWVSGEGETLSGSVSEREAIATGTAFTGVLNENNRVAVIFVEAAGKVSEDVIYVTGTTGRAAYKDADGKTQRGWVVSYYAKDSDTAETMTVTADTVAGFYTATAVGEGFRLTAAGAAGYKAIGKAATMYNGFLSTTAEDGTPTHTTDIDVKDALVVDTRSNGDIDTVEALEDYINTPGADKYVSLIVESGKANTVYVVSVDGDPTISGDVTSDNLTAALEGGKTVEVTGTVKESVTLTEGTVVLGDGAAIEDSKTITVKSGATVKITSTVDQNASGAITLDGGKIEIDPAEGKTVELPKVTGNGVISVADGKMAETPDGTDYLTDLEAKLTVKAPSKVNTPAAGSVAQYVTYTVSSANTVGVMGEGKVESWSSVLTVAEMAARTGGDADSKVIFVKLDLSDFAENDVVNVTYKVGSGAAQEYGGDGYDNWTLSSNEADGTDKVIIPVTSDVTSIVITKVP